MPSMASMSWTSGFTIPPFGTKERMRYERKMRKRARRIKRIGASAWLLRQVSR